jgi:parallel beta-helix repeat protein
MFAVALVALVTHTLSAPAASASLISSICEQSSASVAATADSWIDQNSPSNNNGADAILKLQSKAPSDNFRILVRFPLPPDPPAGCEVGAASLSVYAAAATEGRMLQALRLAGDWAEETITWNNQPATTGAAATTAAGTDQRRWDVTTQVQAMYADGNNYGFLLRDATENGPGGEQQFESREKGESPPVLTIAFVPMPGLPDTTILSAPADPSSGNAATFTFAGSDESTLPDQLAFECRLDAPLENPFVACSSPITYSDLRPGLHSFEVRARDTAGNLDLSAAEHTWVVPATGADASPIPTLVSCGQLITQSTLVMNSLLECPADGLIIAADGIILDLNARMIDGVGLGTGIRNDGYDGVTIRNGTIQEFDHGVLIGLGTMRNVVETLTIRLNQIAGVELSGAGTHRNRIRSNTVIDNANGIALLSGTTGGLVLGNTLSGNSAIGLLIQDASGNQIEANIVGGGSDDAVLLSGASDNTLLDNTISSPGDGGVQVIAASQRNRIERNSVAGTGDAGFVIKDSDGNQLIGNTARDNSDSGIALDAANDSVVRGNDLRFNPGGLELQSSSRNLIESNNASLTMGTGIELDGSSLENVIARNSANGNSGRGIYASGEAPAGLGNRIERNSASGNGSDGIYLAKGGHTFTANIAQGNRGWGIYAGDGNIDAGGNSAGGNGEPVQCFNTICAVDTTIGARPSAQTTSTSAAFTFSSNQSGATFECVLDDDSFATCASSIMYDELEPGAHTFAVRAIDVAGNVDPTPAFFSWVIVASPTPSPSVIATIAPTSTPLPPTNTNTPIPPTITPLPPTNTNTPIPPTNTPVPPTNTPVPPTFTATPLPPTSTPIPPTFTSTPVPPTFTNTPIPPTSTPVPPTFTSTPLPPTFTNTPVPPTNTPVPPTFTSTPLPPTFTNTPVPPTNTPTPLPPTSTPTNTPVPAACVITMATYQADADAWIDQNSAATNKGSDAILKLRSQGPNDNFRALVRFAQPTSLPAGCVIKSATLRLYAASATTGRTLQAAQIGTAWTENGVTWSNQPATTGSAATTTAGSGYREWNVTAQVQAMYTAGANHGFLIRDATEGGAGSEQQLHAKEKGESAPQLVITFAPAGL